MLIAVRHEDRVAVIETDYLRSVESVTSTCGKYEHSNLCYMVPSAKSGADAVVFDTLTMPISAVVAALEGANVLQRPPKSTGF